MKVYFKAPAGMSRAMTRVEDALRRNLPQGVVEVQDRTQADHEVLHVIGVNGVEEHMRTMSARSYSAIQYCVKTTTWEPHQWWGHVWQLATCVWSYYDLDALLKEDYQDVKDELGYLPTLSNFYHAPMGVDANFRRWMDVERYIVGCTGYLAQQECLDEVAVAAGADRKVFHLGPDPITDSKISWGINGPHVKHMLGINDDVLAQMYSRCRYVTGLRRIEGFEMPLAEGLLCGAMPITFDQPHYRKWFDGLAHFIPEDGNVAQSLVDIFNGPPPEPNALLHMANSARQRFNWVNIATSFWNRALSSAVAIYPPLPGSAPKAPVIEVGEPRRHVLWVGDAVVSSGFAQATHGICDELSKRHQVSVLGLHHNGDPTNFHYPVYTTWELDFGDPMGKKRLPRLIQSLKPDVVIIQNDPWNIPAYTQPLIDLWEQMDDAGQGKHVHRPKLVGALAVDGLNCRGRALRHLDHAIFWTEFGMGEAIRGGMDCDATVIPLGVDTSSYYPLVKSEARKELLRGHAASEGFIIGYVGRNQPRKRLDLLVRYFAHWLKASGHDDAWLYLHYAPTGEDAWELDQLAKYYGCDHRLIVCRPPLGAGADTKHMRNTYNSFDVMATCTQGEGWGLPHLEGMACGIPQIVPAWSALGEWPEGKGVIAVECTTVTTTPNKINAIGGIADEAQFIDALDWAHEHRGELVALGRAAYDQANKAKFRWSNIGKQYADLVSQLTQVPEVVAQ